MQLRLILRNTEIDAEGQRCGSYIRTTIVEVSDDCAYGMAGLCGKTPLQIVGGEWLPEAHAETERKIGGQVMDEQTPKCNVFQQAYERQHGMTVDCPVCMGTGRITQLQADMLTEGKQ